MTTKELLERYSSASGALEARLHGLTPEQLTFRPFPEAWTVHEQVAHLADAELVGSDRFRRVIAEDNPTLIWFDQDAMPAGGNAYNLEREIVLRLHISGLAIDQLDQFATHVAQTHEAEF